MMGENPNYWWSLNGKLQPPPSQQAYPNFLSVPPLSAPPPPPPPPPPPSSSIMNPPYLFGSSLLLPSANSNTLPDHQHHDNQDFPLSWSQLLLSGLTHDQEEHNLGHVGEVVKHGYLNQQSRQLYYTNKNDHDDHHHHHENNNNNNNNNDEDLQGCSSSWSSQLNPVPSVGSSSTMSLSTTTMFDFSSKIDTRNHHTNHYSSQYDDTSTSGATKKPRFQPYSTQPSPTPTCNETFTSGTSKRARAQHSSTQTPLKVRKEKLGERISSLHQLVSPFGKTDTASVLLEATAHIRFLESQIEALTSPYINSSGGPTRHQHSAATSDGKKDLGSRGLCLVPVTCLDHLDTTNMTSNGAEFWTPALGGGF